GGAGLGSGGGGGRRGPASAARPPSRATATAALAAQPPLTMKKLCAWVFASGCGKRSTRNTSSSTMIPAHKIARAPLPALAELNLFLHSIHDLNDLAGKGTAFPQDDPRAEKGSRRGREGECGAGKWPKPHHDLRSKERRDLHCRVHNSRRRLAGD